MLLTSREEEEGGIRHPGRRDAPVFPSVPRIPWRREDSLPRNYLIDEPIGEEEEPSCELEEPIPSQGLEEEERSFPEEGEGPTNRVVGDKTIWDLKSIPSLGLEEKDGTIWDPESEEGKKADVKLEPRRGKSTKACELTGSGKRIFEPVGKNGWSLSQTGAARQYLSPASAASKRSPSQTEGARARRSVSKPEVAR